MVRYHRRFALTGVTLDDEPIGGATVDAWQDDGGEQRWAARAWIRTSQRPEDGVLAGTLRDGRRVAGSVHVAGNEPASAGSRVILVDLHGRGPLVDDTGGRLGG